MCESNSKGPAKWTCDYCTYENFPSAIKCTMCKAAKPLLNEDIFRLSPPQMAFDGDGSGEEHGAVADMVGPSSYDASSCVALRRSRQQQQQQQEQQQHSNAATSAAAAAGLAGDSKWACRLCTYLNWPRSLRCVQCSTKRGSLNERLGGQGQGQLIAARTGDAEAAIEAPAAVTKPPPPPLQKPMTTGLKAITTTAVDVADAVERDTPTLVERSSTTTTALAAKGSPLRVQEQLRALRLTTGSDSELNALNEEASKQTRPPQPAQQQQQQQPNQQQHSSNYAGATAANRLSPFEQPTATQLNNLANTSQSHHHHQQQQQLQQQQHQQQQQHMSSGMLQQHCLIPKWVCNTCTYENWPKSLKCSMCGDAKDINTPTGTAATINNASVPNCEQHTAIAPHGSNMLLSEQNEDQQQQHNDTVTTNNSFNKKHIYQLGSTDTINNCDTVQERQERRQRQIRRQVDWQWLNACLGVVENDYSAVEAYLSCGGNPARSLTSTEIAALNRNSAFDVGHTLIHLAIRFHREEMLPMLLAQISGSGPGIKRVPSYVAPDLAADIRRHFANMLRMRKSAVFNCHYVQEHATFALPADIEELPIPIQEQLYDELLDRDAQKQLENPPPALNWSLEITARLGSRLLVLWNRSAGDCLLDSAMQATWGVFDRDNILRRALADSLHQCAPVFYSRWKEYEMFQASMLNFTLEETQWEEDWSTLLSLASQPGSSLEQLHIFALAHILRRPIIVYGVKYVKSFRGEDIGYARFEGLYLPLFWDQNFCIKSPIALGYTRGHFSALVPMEPFARIDARREEPEDVTYLPLMDCESKLLPIHFLTQPEMGREEAIMRQWLDVCVTEGGLMVAQQKLRKRPLLVAQMLEEWLNHYRRIAQVITAPFVRRPNQQAGYSSDGDSDEE